MRRFLLTTAFATLTALGALAQMSDSQIMDYIARETKAGTSQSQIVTRLMQRGAKIDQIRRLRNQYDEQIKSRGVMSAADGAVETVSRRMTGNSDQSSGQELTTAKRGTTVWVLYKEKQLKPLLGLS